MTFHLTSRKRKQRRRGHRSPGDRLVCRCSANPDDAEFTDLATTAISNIPARTDLAALRARIVDAADEERRRTVRDLHDGAQARLVHGVIALEGARAREDLPPHARALVEEGLAHVRSAIDELRELAHGIHPAILTSRGLAAAVDALISATRTTTGLRLDVEDDGVGGAHRAAGRGLAGLHDRLTALDGHLAIDSPSGGGTRITAEIPLWQ